MDKNMTYKLMERLLDVKFSIESLRYITELGIKGFEATEDEEGECLLHGYFLYLDAIEKELQGCISQIDEFMVSNKDIPEHAEEPLKTP